MTNQPDIEAIFIEALKLESSEEREAFLNERCGSDTELHAQIESLLKANAKMGGFLEVTQDLDDTTTAEQVGSSIGPYKLLEQIGEGGMGVVFVAEQRKPIKRRVALKIIKPGMDSKQVVARFSAERQALAMMDHPNIAKVLDVGETESNRPYFVMELVKGLPITSYCDQQKMSAVERLNLFVDVCNAVQHAHQKGVIHRDIKPSNVLVASHDGKPVVKVIDFGVAKAIHQPLTDQTVYTQFSQMVGTPMYMSPEQAGMSSLDVDTRTDIYSLGVLLYELLTGSTPFDRRTLKQAAYDEIRRIIREEEPKRPSTKISSLGDEATDVSNLRRTDPKKLRQLFRGDIDWIVMKALEKDRTRRYETANDFGRDVQRYLQREPVQACPPSRGYRIKKFVQRHKAGVVAASFVTIALVLGLIGTGAGLVWALKEKERADNAASVAVAKEKTTRSILDFMVGLFEEADPAIRLGDDMTVPELLDVGAKRIDELSGEPEATASLQETIGELYIVFSQYDKSETLLLDARKYREERAELSDEDELAYGRVLLSLAHLYQWTESGKGEQLAKQAVSIFERLLDNSPELAEALNTLGNSLQRQNKIPESLVAHHRSLALREKLWPPGDPEHVNVAISLHNIGIAHFYEGDLAAAEDNYVRAISIEQQHKPENDPALATAKHVLSIVYANQQKFENAKRWQQESFDSRSKVFPDDHDHVGLSNNWLGNIYRGLKRYSESEPLLRRAIEIHTEVYGADDALVYWDKQCLLQTLVLSEKFDEAIELQTEMAAKPDSDDGFANRRSVNVLLGDIQLKQNELEKARATYEATATMFDDPDQKMDQNVAVSQLKLATIDARQNRPFDLNRYKKATDHLVQEQQWGEADAQLLSLQNDVADALYDAGQRDEAESIYEHIKNQLLKISGPEDADLFHIDMAADFLVACKDEQFRDPPRGLELAQKVNEEIEAPSPHYMATLAKALLVNGQIDEAIETQRAAIELLPDDSFWQKGFARDLQQFQSLKAD